ncbi:MAG: uracil-DNA glycosylase family protein [Pseudomonadota bacterium]
MTLTEPSPNTNMALEDLLSQIRACRMCKGHIPAPRPVLRVSTTARILIAGQAPGVRVHKSGVPFTDPSGDRLRDWMGVGSDEFYDEACVAIAPMGFCFPGLDAKGGDKPPRRECANTWRTDLMAALSGVKLTLLIGGYAQKWHTPDLWAGRWNGKVSNAVEDWRHAGEGVIPLPHPSWRNNAWLKQRPWFETDLLPHLKARVREALDG